MGIEKVAIVTGGASGIGFEVVKSLLSDDWIVYILDLSAGSRETAASTNPKLYFIQVDVTNWASLSSSFDQVFKAQGRLDFVFANAGILQLENYYSRSDALPPPEPRQNSIDINLKSVINTCYLAAQYFHACQHPDKDAVIVLTASIASFYAQEFNPLYTASKHGVLGFMRSIAAPFYKDNIRTYALCPSTVRTNLLSSWDTFPEEYLTPVETIVSTVRMLVAGGNMKDSKGREVLEGQDYGLAVEVFCNEFFFRDQIEYASDGLRIMCEAASLENQQQNLKSRG